MHILVAIDHSEESHNALETALDVVDTMDGTVTAVHASEPENDSSGSAADLLDDVQRRGEKRGISVETETLEGDPVEVISRYAEERGVDAVYVGHRGLASEGSDLSGDRRGPLGSVAQGIVRSTSVPVTVFDRGL